jgi:hypothetical protein
VALVSDLTGLHLGATNLTFNINAGEHVDFDCTFTTEESACMQQRWISFAGIRQQHQRPK